MARERLAGFSGVQITLHWVIAALVVAQILTGDAMEDLFRAMRRGEEAGSAGSSWHYWSGIAILVLTAGRLAVRIRQGAPPEPADMSRPLAIAARASHHLFYLMLFLAPLTGLAAFYVSPALGGVHSLFKPAFIVLVAIHAAAALWHQFVRRHGVLMRMLRPAA